MFPLVPGCNADSWGSLPSQSSLDPVQIWANRIGTRHRLHPISYSRVIAFGNASVDLVVVWTMQCLPHLAGCRVTRVTLHKIR
jgi:hypothetical protein